MAVTSHARRGFSLIEAATINTACQEPDSMELYIYYKR